MHTILTKNVYTVYSSNKYRSNITTSYVPTLASLSNCYHLA